MCCLFLIKQADLEIFKENILYVLEALNLGYFQTGEATPRTAEEGQTYETNTLSGRDEMAYMDKIEDTYILKAGSHLCLKAKPSFENNHGSYYAKWKELTNSDQVTKVDEEICKLNVDLEFTSPSVCAALVKARATNGLTAWRNKNNNKTLKDELIE